MKVSIHQPDYLPWMGYFNKIKDSDVFVFLDSATYSRNGFHNRNKIKTSQDWCYLTIPIPRDECFHPMKQVKLPEDNGWAKKHMQSIQSNYSKSHFWDKYKDFFDDLYNNRVGEFSTLADLNIYFIEYICKELGIKTKLLRDSQMDINHDLKSSELLLAICKSLQADKYLSGPSGKKYLDLEIFNKDNIEIEFQDYHQKSYKQLFGDFVPGLSILDILFNEGTDALNYL